MLLALHSRTGLVGVHGDLVTFGYGEWQEAGAERRQELADVSTRLLTSTSPVGLLPSDSDGSAGTAGARSARCSAAS